MPTPTPSAAARRDGSGDPGRTARRARSGDDRAEPVRRARSDRPSAGPGAAASDGTTDLSASSATESSEAATAEPDGLPGWVAPGVLVLLAVVAAATLLVRRRRLG